MDWSSSIPIKVVTWFNYAQLPLLPHINYFFVIEFSCLVQMKIKSQGLIEGQVANLNCHIDIFRV